MQGLGLALKALSHGFKLDCLCQSIVIATGATRIKQIHVRLFEVHRHDEQYIGFVRLGVDGVTRRYKG